MVEIKDVRKNYGDKRAVDGISFTVNEGEILGFLGPNGAGKSTTLNIITGYLSADSGVVKIDGTDILQDPIKAKKDIGFLPEIPPLYTEMTVIEYLNFVYDLKGCKLPRKAHLKEICEVVKIWDVSHRLIKNLSKGYRQRVGIAQALIGNPKVLIFDEPTIGLHPRDNERLITMLKALKDRGNTVVVVEHDEEMMRAADWIVDMGPGAGREGGRVVYQGDFKNLLKAKTLTADYLSGRKKVATQGKRAKGNGKEIVISGCSGHNLKNVTARIPLGTFTVVTGVSGSGKSTLVEETLKCELTRRLYNSKCKPEKFKKLTGVEHIDKVIEIDQSPIGRTPRSNPATYVGFFTEIRDLFSKTEAAKARGYGPGRFSFNVKGGRCEVCGGDGVRKLEMSFLPDVYMTCEQCGGKRFNHETLEVKYNGKTISDVLDMTVAEAYEFFAKVPKLAAKLKTLVDVGLGYIGLGQSATTLSGGEAQRIKLATELSKRSTGKTLYLLDEPTTGLHFDDIAKLMKLLLKLREAGNTVVVIEHNIDVMRSADWIIDLGPGGGDEGGNLVAEGTPDDIAANPASVTGRYILQG
jgi:excinuclease ABC subunit A